MKAAYNTINNANSINHRDNDVINSNNTNNHNVTLKSLWCGLSRNYWASFCQHYDYRWQVILSQMVEITVISDPDDKIGVSSRFNFRSTNFTFRKYQTFYST